MLLDPCPCGSCTEFLTWYRNRKITELQNKHRHITATTTPVQLLVENVMIGPAENMIWMQDTVKRFAGNTLIWGKGGLIVGPDTSRSKFTENGEYNINRHRMYWQFFWQLFFFSFLVVVGTGCTDFTTFLYYFLLNRLCHSAKSVRGGIGTYRRKQHPLRLCPISSDRSFFNTNKTPYTIGELVIQVIHFRTHTLVA
jgi:hypothetical protein